MLSIGSTGSTAAAAGLVVIDLDRGVHKRSLPERHARRDRTLENPGETGASRGPMQGDFRNGRRTAQLGWETTENRTRSFGSANFPAAHP